MAFFCLMLVAFKKKGVAGPKAIVVYVEQQVLNEIADYKMI